MSAISLPSTTRTAIAALAVAGVIALAACSPNTLGATGSSGARPSIEHVATDPAYRGWWRSISIADPTPPSSDGVVDTITLAGDAEFDPDSAVLARDAFADMPAVATRLASLRGDVWIAGHTAITATPHANVAFSGRRAHSVRTELVHLGVSAARLHIAACGQRYPQSRGASPSDQARNRIVVIRVSDRPLTLDQACAPVPGK